MKNKFSILITLLLTVILSGNLFAQTAPKCNITDEDVKNFIINFKNITEAFNEIDADIDADNADSMSDIIALMSSVPEVDAVLKQYGISEGNRVAKFVTILYSIMYITTKEQLDQNPEAVEAYRNQGVDLYAQLKVIKNELNDDDLKVVENNKAALIELLQSQIAQ